MDNTPELNELATALAIAQGQIEDADKSVSNPFFKSKYADLAAVRAVIRKPLSDNGLSIVQLPSSSEIGIAVRTVLMHKSGQYISEELQIPVSKQDAQAYGSAISYARRYALMSMLNIAAEDDDGNSATAKAPGRESPKDNSERIAALYEQGVLAASKGTPSLTEWWRNIGATDRGLLTKQQIEKLKSVAEKANS